MDKMDCMTECSKEKAWTLFNRLAVMETDDCVIWPLSKRNGGYGQVWDPTIKYCFRAHVLALEMRWPRPDPAALALHGPCHNPACMNYRHLYWGTRKRNQDDRKRDGTYLLRPRGEASGRAKLTETQVIEIRRARSTGESLRSIARRFPCSPTNVAAIYKREIWRHIP
jgi:hypothetical protein